MVPPNFFSVINDKLEQITDRIVCQQNCTEIIRKENALNGSLETSATSDTRLVESLRTALRYRLRRRILSI